MCLDVSVKASPVGVVLDDLVKELSAGVLVGHNVAHVRRPRIHPPT